MSFLHVQLQIYIVSLILLISHAYDLDEHEGTRDRNFQVLAEELGIFFLFLDILQKKNMIAG